MTSAAMIVVGGGGHASVLLDELLVSGYKVLGIVDPNLSIGTKVLYSKVLGDDLQSAMKFQRTSEQAFYE